MTDNTESKPEAKEIEPQHVVDILRYCMRQYAVAHNLDTEQIAAVTIEDLVTWCIQEGLPIGEQDVISEHCYDGTGQQPWGSKITREAVVLVWKQLTNPYTAVKLLMPIWPWIVEKKPPLKVQPVMMELTAAIVFADNTAFQIQIPTQLADKPITSGFLSSLLYDQSINMANSVAVNGIDALREKYAQPLPSSDS